MEVKNTYRVIIPLQVYLRLRAYIEAVDYEISGLGMVTPRQHANGVDFVIDEIFLLKQECSASQTTLAPEGIALLVHTLVTQERDPGQLKLWWHSHGKLDVFWSSHVDVPTIKNLTDGKGWMLSIVGNIPGKMLARVDLYEPWWVTVHNVEVQVEYPHDEALAAEIQAEVAEKVTETTFTSKGFWPNRIWQPKNQDTFIDFGGFPYDY